MTKTLAQAAAHRKYLLKKTKLQRKLGRELAPSKKPRYLYKEAKVHKHRRHHPEKPKKKKKSSHSKGPRLTFVVRK
jgi:hypothetical protein